MTAILIASLARVERESTGDFMGLVTHFDRIKLAAPQVEGFRAFIQRRQQVVERWDRTVVEIGSRGPNAVQRARFIGGYGCSIGPRYAVPYAVATISVHTVAIGLRHLRDLGVIPVIDDLGGQRRERPVLGTKPSFANRTTYDGFRRERTLEGLPASYPRMSRSGRLLLDRFRGTGWESCRLRTR